MRARTRPLQVIVGPTASGKSALAMHIASHRALAIVGADSRQVYTGFDIGTAKPDAAARRAVTHYGVDVCAPGERYSAHRWAHDAIGWTEESDAGGRPPLIVGGTGFYVHALAHGLSELPALDESARASLAGHLDTLSPATIHAWCARLDAPRSRLGPAQHRRAIEIALLTGRPMTEWLERSRPRERRAVRILLVDPGDRLHDAIAVRATAMIAAGWPEETERLMATVPDDAPAWTASGYGIMRRYISGELPLARATELVIIATRQYAKRQRTWFRHQLDERTLTRIDPRAPDAAAAALAWWDAGNEEPQ